MSSHTNARADITGVTDLLYSQIPSAALNGFSQNSLRHSKNGFPSSRAPLRDPNLRSSLFQSLSLLSGYLSSTSLASIELLSRISSLQEHCRSNSLFDLLGSRQSTTSKLHCSCQAQTERSSSQTTRVRLLLVGSDASSSFARSKDFEQRQTALFVQRQY